MKIKATVTLLTLTFLLSMVEAQEVKVIEKTINRNFNYTTGQVFSAHIEKGTLNINTWKKASIALEVKFKARNPNNQALAKKELQYMRYSVENNPDTFHFKNYFSIPGNVEKVNSSLNANINITLPETMPVLANGYFADIGVKNYSSSGYLKTKYGKLTLGGLRGDIKIKVDFGNVSIKGFEGNLSGNLTHSEADINDLQGNIDLKARQTDFEIENLAKDTRLTLHHQSGKIYLLGLSLEERPFNITVNKGELELPKNLEYKRTDSGSLIFNHNTDIKQHSPIKIDSEFGNIKIK